MYQQNLLRWLPCSTTKILRDVFISHNSAVTAGLGNIVSQKIQKRGKNLPLEYRPVIAFSAYGLVKYMEEQQ